MSTHCRFAAILLLLLLTSFTPARLLSEDTTVKIPLEKEKVRATPNEFPGPTQIGMVVSLKGKGRITGADGSKRALKIASPIFVGDRIDTGLGAYTQITFRDQSKIALQGSSDFQIDSYAYQLNGEVEYKSSVDNGMLSFMAGQIGKIAPQNFKVVTATAVVGIRGTSGEVMTSDGKIPGRPKGLEVMKKGGIGVTLAPSIAPVGVDRSTPPVMVVSESGRGFVMDSAGKVEKVTFTKSPSEKYAVAEKKRIEKAKKNAKEEEEKEEEEAVSEAEEEEAEEEAAEEETAEEEAAEEATEEEAIAEEEAEEQEAEESVADAEEAPDEEPAEVEEQEAEEVAVEEAEAETVEMAMEEDAGSVEMEEAPVEAAAVETAVVETETPDGDFGLMDFSAADETPVVAVEMESFVVEEFSFTDIPTFEAIEVETPQEKVSAVEDTQDATSSAIEAETTQAAEEEQIIVQEKVTKTLKQIETLEGLGITVDLNSVGSLEDLSSLITDTASESNINIEELSGDTFTVVENETKVVTEIVSIDETEFTGRMVGREFNGTQDTSFTSEVYAKERSSDQSLLTAFTNTFFVNPFESSQTVAVERTITKNGSVVVDTEEVETVLSETLTRLSDISEGLTHSEDLYVLAAPIATGDFYSQVQKDSITIGDSTFNRVYDNIAEFVLMEKEEAVLDSEKFLYFGKESSAAAKQGLYFFSSDVNDVHGNFTTGTFIEEDEVGSLLTVNGQKLTDSGGAGFIVDYDKAQVYGAAFTHNGFSVFEEEPFTSTTVVTDPLTGLALTDHVLLPVQVFHDDMLQTLFMGSLNSDASITELRMMNNMGYTKDPNIEGQSGSQPPVIFNDSLLNTFSGDGHLYGSEEEGIGVTATDGANGFFGAGGFLELFDDPNPQVEGLYTGFVQGIQITPTTSEQVHVQGSFDLHPIFSDREVTGSILLDNANAFDVGGINSAVDANYVFGELTSTSQNVFLTPDSSFFNTLELPEFYDPATQHHVTPSGVMWGTWNVVKEEANGDKIIFPGLHNFWIAAIEAPLTSASPLNYFTGASLRTSAGEAETSPLHPTTDMGISEFAVNQDTGVMEGLSFFENGDVMVYKGSHDGQGFNGSMAVISTDGENDQGGVYSSTLSGPGSLNGSFASTDGENLTYNFNSTVFDEGGALDVQYGVGIATRTGEEAAITTESFVGHMEGVTVDGEGLAAPIEGGVIGAEMTLSVFPSPNQETGFHNSAFQVDVVDSSNASSSSYGTNSSSIDTYINKDAFLMMASNSTSSFGNGFLSSPLDNGNTYIVSAPGLNDFQYSSWGRWSAEAINHSNRAVGYFGIANKASEFIPSISTISTSPAPTYHYTGVSVGTVFDSLNPFGYRRTGSVILDVNFDQGQSFGLITYDEFLKVNLDGYLSGATTLNGVRSENSYTIDVAGPQAEEVVGSFSASDNVTAIIGALGAKNSGGYTLDRYKGNMKGVAITSAGAVSVLSGVDLNLDIKGSADKVFGGFDAFDLNQMITTTFRTVGDANVYTGKDSLHSGVQTTPQQNTALGPDFVSQLSDPNTLRPLLDPSTSFLSSMPGLEAYDYISWGVWQIEGLSDTATGYYAIGSDDTVDLPNVSALTSGGDSLYQYTGAARGTVYDSENPAGIVEVGSATLTVDFDDGDVFGNILLGIGHQIDLVNGFFSSTNQALEQGYYYGSTVYNSITTTQGFKGKFHGPLAEESAATFLAKDSLTTIIGAFGLGNVGVAPPPPLGFKGSMEGYVLDVGGDFIDIGFTVGADFLAQLGTLTGAVHTNDPVSGDNGELIVLDNSNNLFSDKNSFFGNLQENPNPTSPVGSFANFGTALGPIHFDPTTSFFQSEPGLEAFQNIAWGSLRSVSDFDGTQALGYIGLGRSEAEFMPDISSITATTNTVYKYGGVSTATVFDSANPGGVVETGTSSLVVDFANGNVFGNILLGAERLIHLVDGLSITSDSFGAYSGETVYNGVKGGGFSGRIHGSLAEETVGSFASSDLVSTVIGAFGGSNNVITYEPFNHFIADVTALIIDDDESTYIPSNLDIGMDFIGTGGTEVVIGTVTVADNDAGVTSTLGTMLGYDNISTSGELFFTHLQDFGNPVSFGADFPLQNIDFNNSFIRSDQGYGLGITNFGRWEVRGSGTRRATGYMGYGNIVPVPDLASYGNVILHYSGAAAATVYDTAAFYHVLDFGAVANLDVDLSNGSVTGNAVVNFDTIEFINGVLTGAGFLGDTRLLGTQTDRGFTGRLYGASAQETAGSFVAKSGTKSIVGAFGLPQVGTSASPDSFIGDVLGLEIDGNWTSYEAGFVDATLNFRGASGGPTIGSLDIVDYGNNYTSRADTVLDGENFFTSADIFRSDLEDSGSPISFGPHFGVQNIDPTLSFFLSDYDRGLYLTNIGKLELVSTGGNKIVSRFGYGNVAEEFIPDFNAMGNVLMHYSGQSVALLYDPHAFNQVLEFAGPAELDVNLSNGAVSGYTWIDNHVIDFVDGFLSGTKYVGATLFNGNRIEQGFMGRLYGNYAEETAGSFVAKWEHLSIVGGFALPQSWVTPLETFDFAQVLEVATLGDIHVDISMSGAPGQDVYATLHGTDNVYPNEYDMLSVVDGAGGGNNYYYGKDNFFTFLESSPSAGLVSYGSAMAPEEIDPFYSTFRSVSGLEGYYHIGWAKFDTFGINTGAYGWGYSGFRRAEAQFLPDLTQISQNPYKLFSYSGNAVATYSDPANPGGIESYGTSTLSVNFESGEVDGDVSIYGISPVYLKGEIVGNEIRGDTRLTDSIQEDAFEGLLAGQYAEEVVGSFVARDSTTFVHGAFGAGKVYESLPTKSYSGEVKGIVLDGGSGLLIEDGVDVPVILSGDPQYNFLFAIQDTPPTPLILIQDGDNRFISKDDFFTRLETSPTGGQLSMGANFSSQSVVSTNTFVQSVPGLESYNYIGWGSWAVEGSVNQAQGYFGFTQSGPNYAPDIQALINTGVSIYTYTGVSVGSIYDASNPGGVFANGSTSLNVDFSNGTVSGNSTLGNLNIGFNNGVISGAGFKGNTDLNGGITTGGFVGKFAGPLAEEAAGSFHARDGPTSAVGAFGVSRPPP
ncbi:MAG: hypothetical protein ACI9S8_001257 [Chlamydiales bacterium]|jgi:hypothetical protein